MADIFKPNNFYFDPENAHNPQKIMALLGNGRAVYLEEIGQRSLGSPPQNAEFTAQILCPRMAFDLSGSEHQRLTLVPSPNKQTELRYANGTPFIFDLLEAAELINQANQLDKIWYKETPVYAYVLRANGLHRDRTALPATRLTQAWKTPINKHTGEPDHFLAREQPVGWSDDHQP